MRNNFTSLSNKFKFDDSNIHGGITFQSDLCDKDLEYGVVLCNSIEFSARIDITHAQTLIGEWGGWEVQWINSDVWNKKGMFQIVDVKDKGKGLCSFVAYDKMVMFDKVCDKLIETLSYPMPAIQLLYEVTEYCGYNPSSYPMKINFGGNDNFEIKDNFRGTNISGRQLLSYIAQVAGGMVFIDEEGFLNIAPIGERSSNFVLNNHQYKKAEFMTYEVEPINWLIVQANDNDFGVQARSSGYVPGERDNVYKITNNPLFYTMTEAEIQGAVNNVIEQMNSYAYPYNPGKVSLFEDFGARCGDIVRVGDKRLLVTSKKISSKGVELSSSGSQYRTTTGEEVNPSIIALRGKTNELERDIEHTSSTLTDKYNGLESKVEQTAKSLTSQITEVKKTADGALEKASKAEQTVGGFSTTIEEIKKTAEGAESKASKAEQTVNGFTTEVEAIRQTAEGAEAKASKAEQTVDGFSQRVTASETKANEAHQMATEAKQTAEGFDLKITQTDQKINETDKKVEDTKTATNQLSIKVDGFDSRITAANGAATNASLKVDGLTLTTTNGDSSSTISLKSGGTVLSSANVAIKGFVTFSDLSTSGKTTINGANITTGKISADRIEAVTVKANVVYDATGYNVCIKGSGNTMEVGGSSIFDFNYMNIYASDRVTFGSSAHISTNGLVVDISNNCLRSQSSTLKWDLGNISFGFEDAYIKTLHLGSGGGYISMDASKRLTVNGTVVDVTGGTGNVRTDRLTSSYNEVILSAQTLRPSGNGTFFFGDSTHYWNYAYFKRIYLGSSCYLTASGSKLAVNGTAIGGSSSGGSDRVTSGSYSTIQSSNTLRPNGTNTYYLGSSSYYWKEVHTSTLVLYYSKYSSIRLTCNSSGKLVCNNKVIG